MEKLVDVLLNSGPVGAALILVVWWQGRKLDRLAELVATLPEKIGERISRIIRR